MLRSEDVDGEVGWDGPGGDVSLEVLGGGDKVEENGLEDADDERLAHSDAEKDPCIPGVDVRLAPHLIPRTDQYNGISL